MKTQLFGSVTTAILGVVVIQSCLCSGAYAGSQWAVPAAVDYQQANNHAGGRFNIQQAGDEFHGTASNVWTTSNSNILGILERGDDVHSTSGTIIGGRLDGDRFTLTVRYNPASGGFEGGTFVYEGTVQQSGIVAGDVYNDLTPRSKIRWASVTPFNRISTASTAPVPVMANANKPIKLTGSPVQVAGNSGKPIKITGRPVQTTQNTGPVFVPQNTGPVFVPQNTGPVFVPQNTATGTTNVGTITNTTNGGFNNPNGFGNAGNVVANGMPQTTPFGFGNAGNVATNAVPNTGFGATGVNQMGGPGGLQNDGPGGAMPNAQQTTTANYSGSWKIQAADGTIFQMNLQQNGTVVSGNYSPRNGMIQGQVGMDGKLTYRWQDGAGNQGAGQFMLAAGGASMNGSFSNTSDPTVVNGTWGGFRQ